MHPHYDVVVLQQCLINNKLNLVKELIKIEHDQLLTMLIPGHILHENFFPFVCTLEKNVLNEYYTQNFHETIQSKKAITGRRTEIFYWEVFGWKKKSNDKETQKKIHEVLEAAEAEIIVPSPSKLEHSNPY